MFFVPRYGEVIGDLYPYMQVPNRTSLEIIEISQMIILLTNDDECNTLES